MFRMSRASLLARLPLYCSAECATPTNSSLFAIFPRILANAPLPPESFRTCFVCATHAHSHFCPHHWFLCHLSFGFVLVRVRVFVRALLVVPWCLWSHLPVGLRLCDNSTTYNTISLPIYGPSKNIHTFDTNHASLPNFSNRRRHNFQLHVVEGPAAGITWSPLNWLHYPDPGVPFPGLYEAEGSSAQSELLPCNLRSLMPLRIVSLLNNRLT